MYNKVPASSAQTAYRLFPPIGENALTPLRLLSPPDPLRWAPAGVPKRRVGVVLPLRLLPGLRPYCVGIQAAPPPDTAPGAVGITGAPAPFLRSPPHPKGTSSALRASQRTMNGKRSREATILLS